jgi:pimeloyl-ACP methyl ester carboxylesterase
VRIEMGQSFEVREAGSGPPVVLVHGYPLDGGMWSATARILSERFRVLKPDLPGRAENPVPAGGSMDSYADFLAHILQSAGPAGVAGFSMGGYAVLALLRRRPELVRALALVDSRAGADDEAGRAKRNQAISDVRERGAAAAADAMIDKLLSPEARGRGDMVERVRRMILRQKTETLESDLTAMRDRADQTSLLPEIRIPTLVIAGELDAITPAGPAREMAAAISGAEFVEIPGAGHLAPVEKPKVVAAALGAFFARALGAA